MLQRACTLLSRRDRMGMSDGGLFREKALQQGRNPLLVRVEKRAVLTVQTRKFASKALKGTGKPPKVRVRVQNRVQNRVQTPSVLPPTSDIQMGPQLASMEQAQSDWTAYHFVVEDPELQIEWKGRPEVDSQLLKIQFGKWMQNFMTRKMSSARDYGYFLVTGGSGTGKTRCGLQIPTLLEAELEALYCDHVQYFISMATWDQTTTKVFDQGHESVKKGEHHRPADSPPAELAALGWLVGQIAASHSPSAANGNLTLDFALKSIRAAHKIPPGKPLVLFVQIDEFQKNLPLCTHLLRMIGSLFAAKGSPCHKNLTFIVFTLSGTWIGKLTVATELKPSGLYLAGMGSLEATQDLFVEALCGLYKQNREQYGPMLQSYAHRQILGMLGFIPRMVLAYVEVCYRHPDKAVTLGSIDSDYLTIWELTKDAVFKNYQATGDPDVLDHLLCLWYFQIPVSASYQLNGLKTTVADAQLGGYVFMRPVGQEYQVVVPLVFAMIWRRPIFAKVEFYHVLEQVNRHRLPDFILKIHQTTLSMLGVHARLKKKLGPQSLIEREYRETAYGTIREVKSTIRELYGFAAEGPPSILDAEVWVNPVAKIVNLPPMGTTLPLPDQEGTKLYQTPELHSGPDGYTPYAAEQYKSSDSYIPGNNQISSPLTSQEIAAEVDKHEGRDFLIILTPKDTDDHLVLNNGVFQTTTYVSPGSPTHKNSRWIVVDHPSLLMVRTAANLEKFSRGLMHFYYQGALNDSKKRSRPSGSNPIL